MNFPNFLRPLSFGLALTIGSVSVADAQGFFNRKNKDTGYITSSEPSAPQDSAIFKSGQPQEVEETSYVIQDGEKVKSKKPRLFGKFLNRDGGQKSSASNDIPVFEGTSPVMNTTPAPTPAPQPITTTPSPAPVEQAAAPQQVTTPLPSPKKERRFGLPNLPKPSLPILKRDNGPVDTSRAEVLVNQGGTLAPSGTDVIEDYKFETASTNTSGSSDRTPPREENGTVVYNSWDDVVAKPNNAADIIVRDMKAQEAEHKRKIAAAKREYEERVKKAQADARIRAIMQGAVPPPPGVPGSGF